MEILGELWRLVWYFFESGSFPTMDLKIEYFDTRTELWIESAVGEFVFNRSPLANETTGGVTGGSKAFNGETGSP